MEIGKTIRTITVTPVELPRESPAHTEPERPDRVPDAAPVHVPDPERVPA